MGLRCMAIALRFALARRHCTAGLVFAEELDVLLADRFQICAKALEIAAVFSGDHNDPESWWEWADKDKQEDRIKRFKRQLAPERTDKTEPCQTGAIDERNSIARRLRCSGV